MDHTHSWVMHAMGIADTSRYMIQPGSPEHQQMMQQQQAQQQQMMQEQQRMQMMQEQMLQSQDQREWARVELDQGKLMVETTDKAADNDRADEQLAHDKEIDWEKIAIDKRKNAA